MKTYQDLIALGDSEQERMAGIVANVTEDE